MTTRSATAALFFGAIPLAAIAAEAPFDVLRAKARDLAAKPYAPRPGKLDDFWAKLSYDQHRDIRFKMESGLWWEQGPFSVDFFHPGWTAKKTVSIFEVAGESDKPLAFDPTLFDYGKQKIPAGTPPPPGYAGWRARTHLNSPDYMDEFQRTASASAANGRYKERRFMEVCAD